MTELVRQINVAATLKQMQVGETIAICFDVIKPSILRTSACRLGSETGRKYSVSADRNLQISEVTRHE